MADEPTGVKPDNDAPAGTEPTQTPPAAEPKSLLADAPENTDNPEPGVEPAPASEPEPDKPIEYTEFSLPDGWEPDNELLGEFKDVAAEAKLPQETAQKFVDLLAKRDAAIQKQTMAVADKWAAEFKAQPDHEAVLSDAARARKHCTPGMQKLLEDPRIGNNPEIIRSLAGFGKMLKEHDLIEANGRPGGSPKRPEDVLFGDMFKK